MLKHFPRLNELEEILLSFEHRKDPGLAIKRSHAVRIRSSSRIENLQGNLLFRQFVIGSKKQRKIPVAGGLRQPSNAPVPPVEEILRLDKRNEALTSFLVWPH
jgi:hypothetical protein